MSFFKIFLLGLVFFCLSSILSVAEAVESVELKPVKIEVPELENWDLKREDQRIDVALKRWSSKIGYGFRWDADRYVLIDAATTFTGDFEYAVRQLLSSPSIKNSSYPLEACLYGNIPPLLRITRMGDQAEDCK
jgi:hypothetical protein